MKKFVQKSQLSPLRSVTVITKTGPQDLPIEEISSESIGCKAYGLSSLPAGWVPPFFVVDASCFDKILSNETVSGWIAECLRLKKIGENSQVMVRSSGTYESIEDRGQLKSTSCHQQHIEATIQNLIHQITQTTSGKVHWIIQERINQKEKGHLSNERRLRKENRDWIAEFEHRGIRPGYVVPVAVRQWRDGKDLIDSDLSCTSEAAITLRLKHVAMWATRLSSRIHFEWVWNGKKIHIVQADPADGKMGVNPETLLPSHISPVEFTSLKVFHLANSVDYELYAKLRNAKLYRQLGYDMPEFYVLNDPVVLSSVLSGRILPPLDDDLAELTKRPLIIRMDGTNIPNDKHEMLPRSEELRNSENAKSWLLKDFKLKIEKFGLSSCDLCLIGHHFIPSVASAWARAEPRNRIVRIESLWGIPEGLYWYSHDTFEVDTKSIDISLERPTSPLKYKSSKRLRYKGRFIAPDKDGTWIPYFTRPPYDWTQSIRKHKWLFEIAHTTRQVAEFEKRAVSVMWFINNHPHATVHKVLPWFHGKSELIGSPKAAPRKKYKGASDFCIRNVDDWEQLQLDLKSGASISRVVVEPVDPELIRNPQFAQNLAILAESKNFVVELSGGLLSHAYYILQRYGAQVECIDLFGADEDIVEYNKLVRDKVPSVIEGRGESTETIKLMGDALVTALKQKLVEESFEVLDAKSGEEIISEIADLQEVVRGLCRTLGIEVSDIEDEREKKEKIRGGFEKGLMLVRTSTPHSILKESSPTDPTLGLRVPQNYDSMISDIADLPLKPVYRRPDLRQVDQELEKLFTFEIETNKIGEVKETLNFLMPVDGQHQRNFTLTVELSRKRSSVRGVVRLRVRRSKQLQIKFPK